MGRLTAKEKIKELSTLKKHNVLMTDNDYKELKLGQLENIEEELGIRLITFLMKYQKKKQNTLKTYISVIKENIL